MSTSCDGMTEVISDTDIPIVPNLLVEIKRLTNFTQAIPQDLIEQIQQFVDHVFAQVNSYGSEHPKMLSYLLQLSELYLQTYQYLAAERLLSRLQTAFTRTYGPHNPFLAKTLMTLGHILNKQSRYSAALTYYQRSYQQYRYLRRKYILEHLTIDETYNTNYLKPISELNIDTAENIDEELSTPLDLEYSQSIYGIAQCYLALQIYDFAIDYYTTVLKFYETTL